MMYDADIEEAECDKNVKTFLKCIDSASMTPGGFAAMKVRVFTAEKIVLL